MTKNVRITAKDLLPGDVLTGSDRQVEYTYSGVKTPRGKVTVKLFGETFERHWGRSTTMRVARHPNPSIS
jgi:hypothetical protein